MTIGTRLREQRNSLGLNQTDLGAIAQVTKQTVYAWENDKTMPKAGELVRLAGAGVDVTYVLSGQRSGIALTPEEAALLDNYRHSPDAAKRLLRETGAALAQPVSGRKRKAG